MMAMEKAKGAFLTIGELAGELGLPQHILRYWETRFPQLRPMQRSGNRRYYRPADAALVRRINYLLNVQGYTVKGARKALAESSPVPEAALEPATPAKPAAVPVETATSEQVLQLRSVIAELEAMRGRLAAALEAAA